MRTTLALDDDVVAYARAHAQRERISIGEAVSRLAREGIVAAGQPRAILAKPKSRYALLPARGETITTEHVRALMDQEGI
ncbi:MAG TPA: hypothetical protein VII31_02320 [Caldimonas sp.]|jgi:hypothetical protein